MRGEVSPRSRAARYVLLLLGVVPLAEIAYIVGPEALVPIAGGLIGAGFVALRILSIRGLEESRQSQNGTESPRSDRSSSGGLGDNGAA